jgi:hypothetical protein
VAKGVEIYQAQVQKLHACHQRTKEAASVAVASFGTKFCKRLAHIRVAFVFHGALIERNISEWGLMIGP